MSAHLEPFISSLLLGVLSVLSNFTSIAIQYSEYVREYRDSFSILVDKPKILPGYPLSLAPRILLRHVLLTLQSVRIL